MTVPRYPYCMITFKYLMPGTPNDGSSRDLVRITFQGRLMSTLKRSSDLPSAHKENVKVCQAEPLEYLYIRVSVVAGLVVIQDAAHQINCVIESLHGKSHLPHKAVLAAVDLEEMGQGVDLRIFRTRRPLLGRALTKAKSDPFNHLPIGP